jgi:hypothetical protein
MDNLSRDLDLSNHFDHPHHVASAFTADDLTISPPINGGATIIAINNRPYAISYSLSASLIFLIPQL